MSDSPQDDNVSLDNAPSPNRAVVPRDARASTPLSPALQIIDQRIATASTDELPELVRQRGELVKQEQWSEEMRHGRELDRIETDHRVSSERKQLNYKLGFGTGVFAVGTTLLVATPLMYPALFCMGFGMYLVAPNYVKDVLKAYRGDDDESE